MKSIKVEGKRRTVEGQSVTFLQLNCIVRPGVCVGSITCSNCWAFEGYDEGKETAVLCSHDDQTLGAFVK